MWEGQRRTRVRRHGTAGGSLRLAGPRRKNGKSKRFSVRISSLEGLLVYRGEFTLIFPVGPVKPFHTQFLGERLEVASMDAGGSKIPGVVQKRRSKTMGARARSGAGRDLPFTFFVSEASVGGRGEGS